MGVAGGRFVGLGADAEPPAPLSMAARSWSASLNGTLSVFTAKSVSALTSTPVSVTNIPRGFAGWFVGLVMDSPGMSRKPANNAFTRSVPA